MNKTALFVLPNDVLGGAELKLKQIAIELHRRGYRIFVQFLKKSVSNGWNDRANDFELAFTEFERERQAVLYLSKILKPYAKHNIEFIFSSNTGLNGVLGIFRKLNIVKTKYLIVRESTQLLDRFGGLKGMVFKSLYYLGYSSTDLVICQTNYMLQRLKYHIRSTHKWNVKVIPNPIDVEEVYSKCNDEIEHKEQYGKYILGVGRLIQLKGFDLLIKSLEDLPKNINLVIVGSGELETDLRALSQEIGLNDRVFFAGYKSNPYPYMKNAEVCVISSRVEGFPNTLLQMMAVNNNCISTLCAGDIDKLNGVMTCDPDSMDALKNLINRAVQLDRKTKDLNRLKYDEELARRTPVKFLDTILSHL